MLSINGTNYVCPFNVFGETKSSGKVNFWLANGCHILEYCLKMLIPI
jgi:hypothetical protein